MATFWSKTLIPTSRQVPADAEVPSHQLMIRAGLIRKLTAGVYDYLPLGTRSLHKVMAVVRQEMDRAGAVEVYLPVLQPIELWEQTGRRTDYGDHLFVVKDRHGREEALGPTHEEVITELVGGYVESYKQLPLTLYQIQTKFRDEFRPRFGVLRSREFQMKDAYSFDTTVEDLDKSYQAMYDAYCRIFDRCGLPYEVVEAESGPIGGSASHEFMVPSATGEDLILKSDKGNYAANVEKSATGKRPHSFDGEPTGDLKMVETPGVKTIADLCAFWRKEMKSKLKPEDTLKTLVYKTDYCLLDNRPIWLVAVVRGDHDANEAKLRSFVRDRATTEKWFYGEGSEITFADEEEGRSHGFEIGFVGPHVIEGRDDVHVVVDFDAAQPGFWVTGANRQDAHVMHFNWKRDTSSNQRSKEIIEADIRNAVDGDPSPKDDGGVLHETRGIEIGHVFKLGTKYSQALDVQVLDEQNKRVPLIMGCYGIGINRIMAAAIEAEGGHDDDGIIWPASIAPYAVLITPIKYEGQAKDAAERIAAQLEQNHGLDVLIDDRAERPGVKFKDADLIGIPLRITIGDKALGDGKVEIKPRTDDKPQLVEVDQAAGKAAELLADL